MKKSTLTILLLIFFTSKLFAQSWNKQNINFQEFDFGSEKISIVDANTIWALSSFYSTLKEFSRTTDGGVTWTSGTLDSIPPSSGLAGIAAVDSLTAYICMHVASLGGAIYKTTDGGATWNPSGAGTVFTDFNSFPNDIYFWDAANGITIGDPVAGVTEIYLTSDSGNTWTQVPGSNMPNNTSGTFTNFGPLQVIDSSIWFPIVSGYVFKSVDKGQTWTKSKIDSTVSIYSLSFLGDKLHGLAIGTLNNLYETVDGGNTWSPILPAGSRPGFNVKAIPGTNYFVSVDYSAGVSNYSTDYGHTWTQIDSSTIYTGLVFKDINTGFASAKAIASNDGGIYKWDPGIVGIKEPALQNLITIYPNPVSSTLEIKCPNEVDEIKISDLTGKILINKKIKSSVVSLEVEILKSGVYFIQIKSGNNLINKKFIKL